MELSTKDIVFRLKLPKIKAETEVPEEEAAAVVLKEGTEVDLTEAVSVEEEIPIAADLTEVPTEEEKEIQKKVLIGEVSVQERIQVTKTPVTEADAEEAHIKILNTVD